MLVLLIVFMVAAPLLTAGVTVDLPEATSDNLPGQDEPLTVTIDSKKRIFLNDTKVSRKNLVTKLKAITKEKTDIRIFVRGDRRVDYGTIMRVIGTMNAAGYGKVGLVTETPSGN
jgi:biopolymer transport protein TolR